MWFNISKTCGCVAVKPQLYTALCCPSIRTCLCYVPVLCQTAKTSSKFILSPSVIVVFSELNRDIHDQLSAQSTAAREQLFLSFPVPSSSAGSRCMSNRLNFLPILYIALSNSHSSSPLSPSHSSQSLQVPVLFIHTQPCAYKFHGMRNKRFLGLCLTYMTWNECTQNAFKRLW